MATSQTTAVRQARRPGDAQARDPMQEFANRIVAELENGVKPWVRPWDPERAGGPQAPFNPVTGKRYHGINVPILGMDMRAFQSGDPRWMTYQQAQEKNWQVRKAERSTTIFFTKPYEVQDDEAEDGTKTIRVLKHYAVFHASQIEGVPAYKAPAIDEAPWTRPEASEIILRNSGAVVRIGGDTTPPIRRLAASTGRVSAGTPVDTLPLVDQPSARLADRACSALGVLVGRTGTGFANI